MTEQDMKRPTTHSSPVGFVVTVREIYDIVLGIDRKMDDDSTRVNTELSKIRSQLAAQWVVHGILLAAIAGLVMKGLGQ